MKQSGKKIELKNKLFEQLKSENAFWSYPPDSISVDRIGDDQLIALTMRYLDLPEINQLFIIYSKKAIKSAWQKILIPEGEYLYTLNRFFAWYYFDAKRPDQYIKSLQTRRLNQMINPKN